MDNCKCDVREAMNLFMVSFDSLVELERSGGGASNSEVGGRASGYWTVKGSEYLGNMIVIHGSMSIRYWFKK